MLPFILGAAGTAVSLYSIMRGTESACNMLDNYVEDNIDINTQSPVMGYDKMTVVLRSKKERRALEAYNLLVLRCIDLLEGSNIEVEWAKKPDHFKFTKNQLRLKYRIGKAFENWWRSGFTGQAIASGNVTDPIVEGLFLTLSDGDKAIIARAHALVVAAEGRGKTS